MIHIVPAFVDELPAIRAVMDAIEYKKRGPNEHDCYEGWYPEPNDIGEKLDRLASGYARDFLNAVADEPTAILVTRYEKGMSCEDHIDQYFGRAGAADTGHRTVSVSVVIDEAEAGGEMVFQDRRRRDPPIVAGVPPGHALFFPADWWHQVKPVRAGIRRAIVQWYADSSGKRFSSRLEDD